MPTPKKKKVTEEAPAADITPEEEVIEVEAVPRAEPLRKPPVVPAAESRGRVMLRRKNHQQKLQHK